MKMSEKGIHMLKNFEGFRAKMYYCVAGKPTIGYGHVIGLKEPQLRLKTLSETEADKLLRSDLIPRENAVQRLVKVAINQNQFDALVDFVFNLGEAALESSTLLRLLNEGKHQLAALQFHRWNKAQIKGKGLVEVAGLTKRRDAERALFTA